MSYNIMNSMQHGRLPYPSLSPRVCSNSCSWSQWCHSIISSPLTPFPSCSQTFPGSDLFPKSQLLSSGAQSFSFSEASAWMKSFNFSPALPMNIQELQKLDRWETKHYIQRMLESWRTQMGWEKLILSALSPEQRGYKVFIGSIWQETIVGCADY